MKENFPLEFLQNWHLENHESLLSGRYITGEMLAPLLENYRSVFDVKSIGLSIEKRPIHSVTIGHGATRILMWSQMHGNESTTTKAVFDLMAALKSASRMQWFDEILSQLTICMIPILNPDGSYRYTRNNAQNIDLNRDAQALSQPESQVLKDLYEQFRPDVCFNLHGQRTIYGFRATGKPSVLSFLSPSANKERSITLSRKRSMSIITHVHKSLQPLLPEVIGRYDDGFNLNCVGDTFQFLETPTVLFEAGHAPQDYTREQCRQYIFLALCSALQAAGDLVVYDTNDYFDIPEHQKCYCDILITNSDAGTIAIQYHEQLRDNQIVFAPYLYNPEETSALFGHKTINAQGKTVRLQFIDSQDRTSQIVNITIGNDAPITL